MKGEVTLTTIGLTILGAIAILLVWGAFSKVYGAFFSNDETCKESENTFNLLTQFVENYVDGTYTVEQSLPLHLGEECVVIGFSKEDTKDLASRPRSCLKESCLCLCSFDKDKEGDDAFDCNLDGQCKDFSIQQFKGGVDGQVRVEKVSEDLDSRIVYLHREEDAIFITSSPHDLTWTEPSDINNRAYLFFNAILKSGPGLYTSGSIFSEEKNYVRVIDEENNLNLVTYQEKTTPIFNNNLPFNGNLYFVKAIHDASTLGGECSLPYLCVRTSTSTFGFDFIRSTNFYFNYFNLGYGDPSGYKEIESEYGHDIGLYVYYDGKDFYGINANTNAGAVLHQFVNSLGGTKELDSSVPTPPSDTTYGNSYVINPKYNKENQELVVATAQRLGIPEPLALGLALQESGGFEHSKDGKVLVGSDGDGYGLMQIDKPNHQGCFVSSLVREDSSICSKADSCSSSDATDLSCNIDAGLTFFRSRYDWCLSIKEKTYDECPGFTVVYSGWDCALRAYNGWACGYTGAEKYVEKVKTKMEEFKPTIV